MGNGRGRAASTRRQTKTGGREVQARLELAAKASEVVPQLMLEGKQRLHDRLLRSWETRRTGGPTVRPSQAKAKAKVKVTVVKSGETSSADGAVQLAPGLEAVASTMVVAQGGAAAAATAGVRRGRGAPAARR